MARFWIRSRTNTTTLTRSDTITTLRDAGVAIRDYFKAGGTGDIGATDAYVQWVGTAFEVVIEKDDMASVQSDLTTFRSNIRTGLLAVQLSGQAFITACTAADIDVIEQSSIASTAGSSWAPSHTSASAPTANNDSSDSASLGKTFGIGSEWITTADVLYVCRDATPTAAVWTRVPTYGVGTTAHWGSSDPATMEAALDRLAERVRPGVASATMPVANPLLVWLPYLGFASQRYGEGMGTVTDQSANAYNATQNTVANRPLYIPGLGASRGFGDFASGSSQFMTLSTQLGRPASWTVFCVFKTRTSSASSMYLCGSIDATGNSNRSWGMIGAHMTFSGNSAGKVYYQWGNDSNYSAGNTTGTPITNHIWHIVTLVYAAGGTTPSLYVDSGTAEALTTASTAASASTGSTYDFGIGRAGAYAGGYTDGYIGAVVVYASALSDADRASVRNRLQGLFGL